MTERAPDEAAHVVVVDDDAAGREPLVRALTRSGHRVTAFDDGKTALDHPGAFETADLVVTDVQMPRVDGLDLLKEVKTRWPSIPVILITGYGSIASSFEAGRLGADDYLQKPLDIHELRRCVSRLLEHRQAPAAPDSELLPGLLGRSPAMATLSEQVRRAAPTAATMLLLGESGTGKDVIANAIHLLSDRKDRTFLPLNCAAIPGHLLESELFGHERGAFTGAVARQDGKFELVGDGTLFLDEIGELALDLQAKLLRVLEERTFMRVGGAKSINFEARLVAASNKDIAAAVDDGTFREDLFYRLKVVSLEIPPLREREGDIRLLADHFLRYFAHYYAKGSMTFSPELLDAFESFRWEGNVRELRNLVESLVVLARGSSLGVSDLPRTTTQGRTFKTENEMAEEATDEAAPRTMDEIERSAILAALEETEGNRDKAARRLGIGLRTLQRKIKEYRDLGFDI